MHPAYDIPTYQTQSFAETQLFSPGVGHHITPHLIPRVILTRHPHYGLRVTTLMPSRTTVGRVTRRLCSDASDPLLLCIATLDTAFSSLVSRRARVL